MLRSGSRSTATAPSWSAVTICVKPGGGESCLTCLGDCGDCACASQPIDAAGSVYPIGPGLSALRQLSGADSSPTTSSYSTRPSSPPSGSGASYVGSGTPSEPDQFTLVIRDGSTGPPTTALGTYGPVAGTRTDLGDGFLRVRDRREPVPSGQETTGWRSTTTRPIPKIPGPGRRACATRATAPAVWPTRWLSRRTGDSTRGWSWPSS